MNTFVRPILLLISFFSIVSSHAQWSLYSPNGKIQVVIQLNQQGSLSYLVNYIDGATSSIVVQESRLGISRHNCDYTQNITFVSQSSTSINEPYSMSTGKKLQLQNHANELSLQFTKCNVPMNIIFRAYDEGVAFRYSFSAIPENEYNIITSELSQVKLATNGKAWMQQNSIYTPAHEEQVKEYNIAEAAPDYSGWTFPALFNSNNFWVMITESDLNKKYFASHLGPYPNDGIYSFAQPVQADGNSTINMAAFYGPMQTPWRVINIGKTAGDIVESNLVHHLSSPSVIANTSWIKPGISSWSWWSNFDSPKDYQTMIPYIDFSSTNNIPYFLVDAFWNQMGNGSITDLVNYATNKNVKLWLWYNSGGPHNNSTYAASTQPRDLMDNQSTRRAEFQKIKNWGVVGVKIDFFLSDKQEIIKLYLDILQDAADYGLMVNFHGNTLPRGWQRTYPNLVTTEAVKGAESIFFDTNYANYAPSHNVNLVFTRNVVSSMDYTPGNISYTYWGNTLNHLTTASHELALIGLFESGIVHLCNSYNNYQALSPLALSMISTIPTAWDETKFVEGIPNNYVILARRKGKNWYISGINGLGSAKSITLNPDFISAGDYTQQLLSDGGSPADINATSTIYQSNTPININMAAYGGFSLILKEKCLNELLYTQNVSQVITPAIVAKQIVVNNTITSTGNIVFSANNSILFTPPFQSQSNSVMKAEIGGCQ